MLHYCFACSTGEDCCRDCCYSTPFITLGTVCFITLSLLGFTVSSIVGTAQLGSIPHLENGLACCSVCVSVYLCVFFNCTASVTEVKIKMKVNETKFIADGALFIQAHLAVEYHRCLLR